MTSILILKLTLGVVAFILGVSFYGATEIIRVPFLGIPATPTDYGFPFERVKFQGVRDVELAGWWIPADKRIPHDNAPRSATPPAAKPAGQKTP